MTDDYAECLQTLIEDYLPNITKHVTEQDMPDTFYQVNRLRRASRDAVHALLELEQG